MLENRESWRAQLREFANVDDPLEKSLQILAVITEAMETAGIRPILVGGRAVELYTHGSYFTYDTDLVINERDTAGKILEELGFQKRSGERHWFNEELDYAIEIPDNVLAGSLEKVNQVTVQDRIVYVIGFEDLIADRLRACYFWKSSRDCEQAESLLTVYFEDVDFKYLREQIKNDKLEDQLEEVIQRAKANREKLGISE